MFALITGRSSLNAKGVHVHLGIIEADYEGEIQILMSAAADIQFAKGDRMLSCYFCLIYLLAIQQQAKKGVLVVLMR